MIRTHLTSPWHFLGLSEVHNVWILKHLFALEIESDCPAGLSPKPVVLRGDAGKVWPSHLFVSSKVDGLGFFDNNIYIYIYARSSFFLD